MGAKLVCEKIWIDLKSSNKKSKPGWEIRLEIQIRKLRKQAKMIKQKKRWNMKKNNTDRTDHSKTMKENSTNKLGKMTRVHTNNRMRQTEQFGSKIWQPREHSKKAEWISNTTKELERFEEGSKAEKT